MRDARWAWVLTCCTLGSCGGRYDVGVGGDAGAGGASGSSGSVAASGPGGASSATGSASTTAGSTTSTGAGGSGSLPMVDNCVMTSMKGCSRLGCHGRTAPVANLNLSFEALTTNYKALYYDKPNEGIAPEDPSYCRAGAGKLIDSANPTQSLIYAKLRTLEERNAGMKPPCGDPMPAIDMLTDADKACVLSWINSVIAASKASP